VIRLFACRKSSCGIETDYFSASHLAYCNQKTAAISDWSDASATQDLHPIHPHLVRFQLRDRHAFDVDDFLDCNRFHYTGEPASPQPRETGWKDTIQAHPGARRQRDDAAY
jgi:hypothetical protein